jgi:hypothetical protein
MKIPPKIDEVVKAVLDEEAENESCRICGALCLVDEDTLEATTVCNLCAQRIIVELAEFIRKSETLQSEIWETHSALKELNRYYPVNPVNPVNEKNLALQERAAIVRWLRDRVDSLMELKQLADLIEQGEHLKNPLKETIKKFAEAHGGTLSSDGLCVTFHEPNSSKVQVGGNAATRIEDVQK